MDTDSDHSDSSSSSSVASPEPGAEEALDEVRRPHLPNANPNASGAALLSHLESMLFLSPVIDVLGGRMDGLLDRTFDRPLGKGTSFEVQAKTIVQDGQSKVVAIKWLTLESGLDASLFGHGADHGALRPLLKDAFVMEKMEKSSFILDLLATGCRSDLTASTPYLVVELSTHGSLTQFLDLHSLKESEDFPAYVESRYSEHNYSIRKSLLMDVAMGLVALHEHGIFHTDLKPDNILIFSPQDSRYRAKLSDFGFSVIRTTASPDSDLAFGGDVRGTKGYKAPELNDSFSSQIQNASDSELRKLDVFSFAPVLVETITSCRITEYPFNGNLAMGSIPCLTFLREQIGPSEWENVLLQVLNRCLPAAASRCDSFVDILAFFGQDEEGVKASTRVSLSRDGVDVSKILASFNFVKRLGSSDLDFEIEWFFKNCPIFAFEQLGLARHLQTGLKDLQSFPELIRKWANGVPKDTAEHCVVSGLSRIFGGAAIDFDMCCQNLLEAARKEFVPAQITYRRINEALFSIYSIEPDDFIPDSFPSPLSIKDISPEVFEQLQSLESAHEENFLAQLIRFCECWSWSWRVYSKICQESNLDPDTENLLSWGDSSKYHLIRNELVENFMRTQIESIQSRHLTPESATEDDIALASLLMAAAIIFGDQNSTQLPVLCDVISSLGMSLDFQVSLFEEVEPLSPLMLACLLGSANAVKILCKAGRIQDTELNRFQSSGGAIPLHFLFTFPESDMGEICSLLSQGISPQDGHSAVFYPSGQFCALIGSPLEFSLRVGSEAATRTLWQQVYSMNDDFLKAITLWPGLNLDDVFQTHYEMTTLDVISIKFLSSMSPSIWKYFLSTLSEETTNSMKSSFREALIPVVELETVLDRGMAYFQTICFLTTIQIPHMLLHGPKYTQRLISQICYGLEFFMDLSSPILAEFILTQALSLPEPHFQAAVIKAIESCTRPAITLNAIEPDMLKSFIFLHATKAESQGASSGHALGFVMSKAQPLPNILDALYAAAMADDMPAFRRIVHKAATYQINLFNQGSVEFLCAMFAKDCPPHARQYLQLIIDTDVPTPLPRPLCWFPRRILRLGFEGKYSKTGRVLWDAIEQNNSSLVLLLIEHDPSILYPRIFSPGIFHLICANDKYHKVLKALLESLGPVRSLEALRRRSRISRISAFDVAVYQGSQQCLLQIARFLLTGGFSANDIFPPADWGSTFQSLLYCATGTKIYLGTSSFLRSPWSMESRTRRSNIAMASENRVIARGLRALFHFIQELSHEDIESSGLILSFLKKYFGSDYDAVLEAESSNYSEDSEDNPGRLAGEVWLSFVIGKMAWHWKVPFVLTGLLTSISIVAIRYFSMNKK